MKINQLKAGVILSYATQLVQVLSGLLYTPVMIRLLGQSEYGLYQLVHSVVAYLGLLSFGFGAGYVRFYSRFKAKNDDEGIARLNGMFIIIFLVIAGICLLCGGVMTARADVIFGDGLTETELSRAKCLMAMMVFNMSLSFVNSVFTSNITAREKFFFQRIVEFLRALFNPFLTLPLLIIGFGSVGMVAVSTFLTIFAFVMNMSYCFNKLKIKFSFKHFDFMLIKEIWAFTFFVFINMIVDQINWSIDKLLLGRMIGTAAVAVYGVSGQLNSMYINFSTAVSSVFIPRVNMLVADKNDNGELTRLFTKVGRVQFLVLGLAVSGYVLFGKEFIGIWAGNGYEESYQIGLFLMLPVTIPLTQNLGIEIQRAKNMHKTRSVVYLLIAVSNIFISIPCIKLWGIKGAAIGTALSLLAGNGLFMNIYYHKKIGLNILYFWKEILKLFPALAAAVAAVVVLKHILPTQNPPVLFGVMILYCICYTAAMWFLGMNASEKDMLSAPILKLLKKAGLKR
ncbi:MAG: oligosaccharide flippase family protein [Clostridiales bacterium]|nr:oligosaccharide flippase family protein [Clostridiales bacterium]